jgi:hypothetical protein
MIITEMDGTFSTQGGMRNSCNILVGKSDGKRPFGIPRRRWEDNIRTYFWEIGWKVVDWIHRVRDKDQWWALVNTVMNLRLQKKKKGGQFLDLLSDCWLLKKDFVPFSWLVGMSTIFWQHLTVRSFASVYYDIWIRRNATNAVAFRGLCCWL